MATVKEFCRHAGLCPEDVRCSVCGEPGAAIWVGEEDIVVCRRCAFEVLPKLMADAVLNSPVALDRLMDVLEDARLRFSMNFYRACLIGFWKKVRAERMEGEVCGERDGDEFPGDKSSGKEVGSPRDCFCRPEIRGVPSLDGEIPL